WGGWVLVVWLVGLWLGWCWGLGGGCCCLWWVCFCCCLFVGFWGFGWGGCGVCWVGVFVLCCV
ncbi:hypothetical protein, partial [Pseudomonas syringae group genomosp. 7]|uniref:hypothetical protein n=1 Tax=Pseudomonas syringae group genomosp. 7 TaxID=251699 RepID=UPI00376F5076